jgi:hypothetical protein
LAETHGGEAAAEPVTGVEPEPTHEHAHAEEHSAEAAKEHSAEAAPEPQAEPVAEREPEPLVAANDAIAEPAIKPIIVGAGEDVVVEKKRGWWRR